MTKFRLFQLLLAVFCCGFMLTGCGGGSPEDVAKDYYTAIAAGNVDKAFGMVDTSNAKSEEIGLMTEKLKLAFRDMQKKIDASGGLKSVDIISKSLSEDGNKATVSLRLNFNDGTSREDHMYMVKVENAWKISIK